MSSKPKLYILDDDVQYAALLVEVAAKSGWLVTAEQSAATFLSFDLTENFILVLDLHMPEIDGIEVIRALAEKKANFLLILISGFDERVLHSAQQLAEAHKIKVLASMVKPIDIQRFINILDTILIDTEHFSENILAAIPSVSAEELQQAILQHQLVLYYQPQLDMKTSDLLGVEALVRWQHPELGLVFPGQFIYLAEKNDLIGALTEEIINIAVAQSQKWQAMGFSTVISVNVSADNITSLSLPEQLISLTNKHEISPEAFALEITETSVMEKLTSSLDVLNRLRMKGFSLSIDDFGTGYSSLTHLYQAPFKVLKIDQRFVMSMLEDKEAMVIVEVCIMLGKKMGMKLVAEGVETQGVWNKLKQLNCDIAQGYFIAKPMPENELIEWAKNRE
jgi:EAL domain-containing protein (putative c-di-GMP-specific phosphodiesterase class I)